MIQMQPLGGFVRGPPGPRARSPHFRESIAIAGGSGGGDGDDDASMSPMAIAQMTCDEILEEVNEKKFPTDDVSRGMNEDDKGPYQFVFLQECEYMNALLYEMVKGLQELEML